MQISMTLFGSRVNVSSGEVEKAHPLSEKHFHFFYEVLRRTPSYVPAPELWEPQKEQFRHIPRGRNMLIEEVF